MTDAPSFSDKYAVVVGVGTRGQVVAAHLAAAGVGRIGLVDGAFVEERDLRGGPLTFKPDLGSGKADSMAVKLGLINEAVHAEPFPANVDEANAELILQGAHVVVDCTDNGAAHLRINDACVLNDIPLVAGDLTEDGGWWMRPVSGHCLHAVARESDTPPEGRRWATDAAVATLLAATQAAAAIGVLGGDPPPGVRLLHAVNRGTLTWATRQLTCSDDCICRADSAAGNV